MSHVHRALVIVAAAISLVAIMVGAARQESLLRDEPRGEIPIKGEGEWIPVAGDLALPAAERLVALAKPQWIAGGMTEERAALLAADATQALGVIMQPDFDRYKALVAPRSMTVPDRADEDFRVALYPPSVEDLGPAVPWETQLRYMWNHPGPRNVEWSHARIDEVKADVGARPYMLGGKQWPWRGEWSGLAQFVAQQGRLDPERGQALAASTDMAWIRVHARFTSDEETGVQLLFYWEDAVQAWLPQSFQMGGGHTKVRLFFMF